MGKKRKIIKVSKHFSSFSAEEQWLQDMLQEGWMLQSYDSEDIVDCQYIFEPVTSEEQKNIIYKIDFREFKNNEEFEEYKGIFEDAGWTLLAKNKWYAKHIFYTSSKNPRKDIFSDRDAYRERERRKMASSLTYVFISVLFFIVLLILYLIFDRSAFMGVGLFALGFAGKSIYDYYRHKKVYKTLLTRDH